MIAIIIVNHKGKEDTIECIESILNLKSDNFRIYIVDNSPNDNDLNYMIAWLNNDKPIKTLFPEYVLPLNKKPILYDIIEEDSISNYDGNSVIVFVRTQNKGFSHGNNVGIKVALLDNRISYFWLLNNDTVVPSNFIDEFKKIKISDDHQVGIYGCILYEYFDKRTIQAIGGKLNKYLGTIQEIRDVDHIYDVDYPIGASIILTRNLLDKIKGLDESFFLYFEELSLVNRAKEFGFNFLIVSDLIVYHKGGASTKSSSSQEKSYFADYHSLVSRVLFMSKYYKSSLIFVYISFIFVIANRIIRGRFKLIIPILLYLLTRKKVLLR